MSARSLTLLLILFLVGGAIGETLTDTHPFLVLPDGKKVIATHVWTFPLKRESSGLTYDSVSNQFFTCFDKGIPQLASFRLSDSIYDVRQLTISNDTSYYDLEGVALQRSDSLGVRLKLCGERVIRDSLPILTLRCNADSCWHDSNLVLIRPFTPGKNTNLEGIAVVGALTLLAKEREPAKLMAVRGKILGQAQDIRPGIPFTADSAFRYKYFLSHPAYSGVSRARIVAAERLAFSDLAFDKSNEALLVVNRPGRALLLFVMKAGRFEYRNQCRYELVDHPLEWDATDTGDLLYGLVEGIAIGPVNGRRSLVMITDPGFGNYPKVVVFP